MIKTGAIEENVTPKDVPVKTESAVKTGSCCGGKCRPEAAEPYDHPVTRAAAAVSDAITKKP